MNIITAPGETFVQTHPKQRRNSFVRWTRRILGGLIVMLVALAGLGATYQAVATARDRAAFPAPGRLVDVGGYKLHIHCTGQGSPAVVLDTLADGTSVHWAWVQPELAKTTRVCSYDRAGRGWSEAGSAPRDGLHAAADLHALLHNAGVPGPYVLVGHSYGAAVARLYADQYPDEVVGMALIDGALPGLRSERFPREAVAKAASDDRLVAIAPTLAGLGILRLSGALPAILPPQQQAQYEALYAATDSWTSLRAANEAMPLTEKQLMQAGSLGSRPLMIVNATTAWLNQNESTDESRRIFNSWWTEQLSLSSNSQQRFVQGASHASLVLDQQHAAQTSAAIVAVVEAVRTGQTLTQH